MRVFFFDFFRPLKFRIYDPDKSHRCRFFEFFSPFFCTRYTGIKCEKSAKIHFLWCLNCFYEFSLCLVSVLNDNNCLEVIENCVQAKFLSFNTDTKHRENSKEQFKHHKSEF